MHRRLRKASPAPALKLSQAVRPGDNARTALRQGYRIDVFRDQESEQGLPRLQAAVSAEQLFDTFLELLDPLGEVVDVVLETSHHTENGVHEDLHREHIDLPILQSHCLDHEQLLVHDGFTGIAVVNVEEGREVQFDEHKLLIVYAADLTPFQQILEARGVHEDPELALLIEDEHFHCGEAEHADEFERFSCQIGATAAIESMSW